MRQRTHCPPCLKVFYIPDSWERRQVRCKVCRTMFIAEVEPEPEEEIPEVEEVPEEQEERPRRPARRPVERPRPPAEEGDERPRRRRTPSRSGSGSSSTPLLLGGIGGGMVVVGGLIALIIWASRRDQPFGQQASTQQTSPTAVNTPAPEAPAAASTASPGTQPASSRDPLEAAIAEADRLDPGWRIEQLEAKRTKWTDPGN